MWDPDKKITHPYKLPVYGNRRFWSQYPGITGKSAPPAKIVITLQGNFFPFRAAKDYDGRDRAGP
jgi:hypothetical protein